MFFNKLDHPVTFYLRLMDDFPFISKKIRRTHSLPTRLDRPGECRRIDVPRSRDEAIFLLGNYKKWPSAKRYLGADYLTTFDFSYEESKYARFSFVNFPRFGIQEMRYSVVGNSFRFRMDDGRWNEGVVNMKAVMGMELKHRPIAYDYYPEGKGENDDDHDDDKTVIFAEADEAEKTANQLKAKASKPPRTRTKLTAYQKAEKAFREAAPDELVHVPVPNSPYFLICKRRTFGTRRMIRIVKCLVASSFYINSIDRQSAVHPRIFRGIPQLSPTHYLPVGVWLEVFKQLEFYEKIRIRRVCRQFRDILDRWCFQKMIVLVGISQEIVTMRRKVEKAHPAFAMDRASYSLLGLTDIGEIFNRNRPCNTPFKNLTVLEVYLNENLHNVQMIDLSSLTHLTSLAVSGSCARVVSISRFRMCKLHTLYLVNNYIEHLTTICPYLETLKCEQKQIEIMLEELNLTRPRRISSVRRLDVNKVLRLCTMANIKQVFPNLERLTAMISTPKELLALIRFHNLHEINVFIPRKVPLSDIKDLNRLEMLYCNLLKRVHLGLNLERTMFHINGFRVDGSRSRHLEFVQYFHRFCFGTNRGTHLAFSRVWADQHRIEALRSISVDTEQERNNLTRKVAYLKLSQTLILNASLNPTFIANTANYWPMLTHLTLNHNPRLHLLNSDRPFNVNFLTELYHLQSVHLIGPGFDYQGVEDSIRLNPQLTTVRIERNCTMSQEIHRRLVDAILLQSQSNPHLRYVIFLPVNPVDGFVPTTPDNLRVF